MPLTIKHAVVAAVLMLSFAVPVAAGPFEDAVAAHNRGDHATSLRLLRPLAEQGHVGAQYNLGNRYANGHGVPQDYTQAMKWFRLAAEQGDASAQFDLGIMYTKGQGVTQDYAQAMKWYRLAAEQGLASAQYNLGNRYAKGEGVPQDYVRAHMWSNLAAAQGDNDAAKNRDITAKRMTPAQITEAQKLAREWKPSKP